MLPLWLFVRLRSFLKICNGHENNGGPGSVAGIATGYGLDGPGIESRWGRDFPHLSRSVLGPHPASCIMGTESFPGVKSGRVVTLTPHPLLVPLGMKEYSCTSTPPMGRTACTEPQCLYKGALYKNNERIFVHEFSPYAFGSMHYGNTIINLDCGSI